MKKENKNSPKTILGSENQYYSLFSENTAVMLLIDPSTGNIVDANEAACKFYGYTLKELTNIKIQNINTLSEEQVAVEMERAKKLEQNHFLFEHRIANGTIKPVEVYSGKITLNNKPLLFSIIHDITKRKKAEEKLRKKVAVNERLMKHMVGREIRMAEIKQEINEVLVKSGQEKKYL